VLHAERKDLLEREGEREEKERNDFSSAPKEGKKNMVGLCAGRADT